MFAEEADADDGVTTSSHPGHRGITAHSASRPSLGVMAKDAIEQGTRVEPPATSDLAPGPRHRRSGQESVAARLGLDIPSGSWPSAPLLKEIEAAGFGWTQIHSPPAAVLATPRLCNAHAAALTATLETTGLRTVVHGPNSLLVGSKQADRVFEGLLSWAADLGADQVVYHARSLPDAPGSETALLFETRSLARLAMRAERLRITIAIENLAPVFPGIEALSANPMTLRGLVHRIGSDRLGICLDLGHAHIVADSRHTTVERLIEPVLDVVSLFHLHDNLGARWNGSRPAGLDPLRLDLHLPPGRGDLPWGEVAPHLADHRAPLVLEIHAPFRPRPEEAFEAVGQTLAVGQAA
jgi:sugar phosphate isomerase/epimerase